MSSIGAVQLRPDPVVVDDPVAGPGDGGSAADWDAAFAAFAADAERWWDEQASLVDVDVDGDDDDDERLAGLRAVELGAVDASAGADEVQRRAEALLARLDAAKRAESRAVMVQLEVIAALRMLWTPSSAGLPDGGGDNPDQHRHSPDQHGDSPDRDGDDERGRAPSIAAARPRAALDLRDLVDPCVVTEVALACRTSQYAAWQRLHAADALITDARLPRTAALLEAGLLDWPKVAEITRGTRDLSAADALAVEARIADGLVAMNVPTLRRAIGAAVAAVDAQAHADRSSRERARRTVTTRPGADPLDGMGHIDVYAPADAVAAVSATLDAAVVAARAAGDVRSAGEVRCDELLSRVTLGTWTGDVPSLTRPEDPSAIEPRATGGRAAPRLSVVLTMSFDTWAGLADDPARLEGYGPVAAGVARGLVAAMGDTATWRCAVTDTTHGTLLGLGKATVTSRPTPTSRAVDVVTTAQPSCSVAGCGVRAAKCDLDHAVPYPAGVTCECNLQPLCRTHHRLKTAGLLTPERVAHERPVAAPTDGGPVGPVGPGPRTTSWTTRGGRTYVTREQPLSPAMRPLGAPRVRPPRRPVPATGLAGSQAPGPLDAPAAPGSPAPPESPGPPDSPDPPRRSPLPEEPPF